MSAETVNAPTDQQIRDRVHHAWGSVATAWDVHADHVEARAAALSRLMIDAVAPVPGDEVLELACGAGGLGLAVADRVAPAGRVVLSDVAPEMVAVALARADALARSGARTAEVSARVVDLENIDLPDASFDAVVCREGLMFALDPEQAVREIVRVLRPGGRLALAVWGPRSHNPWLGVLADAVEEHTGRAVPPPGIPGPFSLGTPGALAGILAATGLEQVHLEEVAVPTHDASFEDYWQLRVALAGPLKGVLATLPERMQDAIRETVRTNLAVYETEEGFTIPGLSYLASARAPAIR